MFCFSWSWELDGSLLNRILFGGGQRLESASGCLIAAAFARLRQLSRDQTLHCPRTEHGVWVECFQCRGLVQQLELHLQLFSVQQIDQYPALVGGQWLLA
jgi:hypothetical protein